MCPFKNQRQTREQKEDCKRLRLGEYDVYRCRCNNSLTILREEVTNTRILRNKLADSESEIVPRPNMKLLVSNENVPIGAKPSPVLPDTTKVCKVLSTTQIAVDSIAMF
ncbi:hypothetical protein TNIN_180801 [Trichonephila inaurata madagascariensis]|uniref:Uncharacterized protein n=1 Tax=Trichonephila inaurata madagascariensis TaxID=2747483 RepID=A0A8X6X1R4_9ARAC|nr:hypothetical protein TNIN_180801 [Trichonephila inaurata madagascariensis]